MELRERVDQWLTRISDQASADSRATAEAFHKVITTLASGAIGVSVIFIEKLVPQGKPVLYRSLLLVSWALLVLSLILILVGFRLTLSDYFKMGRIAGEMSADAMFKENYDIDDALRGASKFKPSRIPDVLSWLAVVALLVGIACLLAFTAINYV